VPAVIRSSLAVLLPLSMLSVACGAAAPEARDAATPPASAEPSSDAPAAPPAPQSPDADSADGVRRWASWEGPKDGAAVTTKRAWVVAPNRPGAGPAERASFAAVDLRVVDVEKSDASELIFRDHKLLYAVPAALAWPAEAPRGLVKGAAVRCAFGGNAVVARVEAADAKSVTCAFRFQDRTRRERVPAAEVLRLGGKLEPGAPALVRFESESSGRYRGVVMAVRGEDVWVTLDAQFGEGDPRAGRAVHRVKAASVELLDLATPLKAGEPCQAADLAKVVPCKVGKVIEGGLAYVVEFEGGAAGDHKEWTLDEVARAPRR
jgi:hypothetical protein